MSAEVGDLCTIKTGRYLPKEEYSEGGPYPVYGSNSVMGSHSAYLFEGPLIVMAAIGANASAVRFSPGSCWVNNNAWAILPDTARVEPAFLWLWFENGLEVEQVLAGTGQPYVKRPSLIAQPVSVPSLAEQRRIVDLIDAIDQAILRATVLGKQAKALLEVHLELLHADSYERLGDLAEIGSGPSWKSDQEHAAPLDGGQPVIGITNTRPDGRLDLTDRRYVVGLSSKVKVLTERSLIMIRTNGNRQRIGNVYRATPDAAGSAVSAFQIGMEPTHEGNSDFLFWALRRPSAQAMISNAASGTTGLGNVAVKWLRELELPWPEDSRRKEYVEVAEVLLDTQNAAEAEVGELRAARKTMVRGMLSGDHEIPESYDALLESV